MAHYFVTGACGFIGTNLVARLRAAGHDVTAFVHYKSRTDILRAHGARIAQGDVTDPESLHAALADARLSDRDVVYHLAGLTRAFSSRQFAAVNAAGTQNVARACAAQPSPPTLVSVSSIAAGGPSQPGAPHAETDADEPVCAYGRSKLAGEQALFHFANQLPISIARPAIVFGPGDRDNLAVFQMIRWTGLHVVPRRGEFPMSFIHVADLITALESIAHHGQRLVSPALQSASSPPPPSASSSPPQSAGEGLGEGSSGEGSASRQGIYNIADPTPSSYADLGRLAAVAMNQNAPVLRIHTGWFYLPALCGELVGRAIGRPLLMNFDKLRDVAAPGWVCATERIERELGFQPEAPLAERFRQTAQWYREAGWIK